MSDSFIDSNVFVYLADEGDQLKQQIANTLVDSAIETRESCISFQVVQETLNVLTRRILVPMNAEDAGRFFERFLEPLWTVMPTAALYLRTLSIQARYRYSFYDCLIIAAALEAGCRRLFSEDLQAGQTIEGLTIVNPFT